MKTVGSNKLLIAQGRRLSDQTKPDVRLWFSIYSWASLQGNIFDRSGTIEAPYTFHNLCPLPRDLSGFNKSYYELSIERASELLNKSRTLNKPLLVMWSGGIDSTGLLVSLILAGASEEVVIALSKQSLSENYIFYNKHIRGKFKIVSSENFDELFVSGKYILVTGEVADYLFGPMGTIKRHHYENGNLSSSTLFKKYNKDDIIKRYQIFGLSKECSLFWVEQFENTIKNAPCPIERTYDFLWWVPFILKWQWTYYRLLDRIPKGLRTNINKTFLEEHYEIFYGSENFQKWSMLNPDKKLGSDWRTYKLVAKQFIYDFDKNKDYFDNKVKFGSLANIVCHRYTCDAIDENFNFIDNLNKEEFYNPNNSFIQP